MLTELLNSEQNIRSLSTSLLVANCRWRRRRATPLWTIQADWGGTATIHWTGRWIMTVKLAIGSSYNSITIDCEKGSSSQKESTCQKRKGRARRERKDCIATTRAVMRVIKCSSSYRSKTMYSRSGKSDPNNTDTTHLLQTNVSTQYTKQYSKNWKLINRFSLHSRVNHLWPTYFVSIFLHTLVHRRCSPSWRE